MDLQKELESTGKKMADLLAGRIEKLTEELEKAQGMYEAFTGLANGAAPKAKARPQPKAKAASPAKKKRSSPDVDWAKVLSRLPKSFTSAMLAKKTPALEKFPKTRIMALARWSKDKQIKKTKDGYTRLK